jgi:hypothetical protein
MRKTIVAMFALAAAGLVQPTVVSARGAGGGFGAGGGYPASFGGNYAEGGGDCHLVEHRVMTRHHGWRIRRVQVCS